MTKHSEIAFVDDAAFASSSDTDPTGNEGGSGAPATPPQEARAGRVQQLIRDKQTAEAIATRSAAQAAVMRGQAQNPGRPQDYRAPEDYTRAVAEQAVREVGADMLARQAAQAQELAAKAAQDAWAESTAEFRQRVPDFDAVAHNPNLTVTPVMADAIREIRPRRPNRLLSRQEPCRSSADSRLAARVPSNGHRPPRRQTFHEHKFSQPRAAAHWHPFWPRR